MSNIKPFHRVYALPDVFWESLFEIRQYLMSDERFGLLVFGIPRDEYLAAAFGQVDYVFEQVWQEWLATKFNLVM